MMRESELKKKLRNGEVVSLVFLESTHPGTAETLALAGCDIICIDNEHGCFSSEQISNTARAITALGKAAILRTTCCDPNVIAHYMDCGLSGIFATMVKDAKACQDVINGVKFAPVGKRGVCFNSRAAHFGMHGMSVEDYLNWCNDNTVIMVDVECVSAIDDLDNIIALKDIDVVHTGMWDLASAYGHYGHPEHPEAKKINDDAVAKIIEKTGICCAYAPDADAVPDVIARGFQMINLGGEYDFIANHVKACQAKIDEYNAALKQA